MEKSSIKHALLNEGLKLLGQGERIEEISLRSLAANIGVSSGAPYRHFKDQNQYIAALASEGFGTLIEKLESATSFTDLGKRYVEFAWAHPLLYEVMFYFPARELPKFPHLAELASRSYEILESWIDTLAKEAGSRWRLSKQRAAQAAWAYVHGLASLGANELLRIPNGEKQSILEELGPVLIKGFIA